MLHGTLHIILRRLACLLVCLAGVEAALWVAGQGRTLRAQEVGGTLVFARIMDGDTIPHMYIPEVVVTRPPTFTSQRQYRAYQRLIRNLKKVYPYAVVARQKLREMDSVYTTLDSEWARKRYSARMEKELSREFEQQLRNLTYSQGKLLLKLIDRETGRTTYEIIKQFRGGTTAAFWQVVARMFGSNLKSTFNPTEEDKLLNELIILYEHGQL